MKVPNLLPGHNIQRKNQYCHFVRTNLHLLKIVSIDINRCIILNCISCLVNNKEAYYSETVNFVLSFCLSR